MKKILLFIFILSLACILRFVSLETIPSGFQNDEASFYINAISIRQTSKDEDNRKYPIYLNSFMDQKPALFSYVIIPFTYLTKSPVMATRIPSVIFGVLSLVFVFFIVEKLTNKQVAFLTMFLFAISPWHIMNSRSTQEVIFSFLLSLISIFFLIKAFEKKHASILSLLLSSAFAAISMYIYHSAKIFLPLFLPCLTFLLLSHEVLVKKMIKSTFIFILLISITAAITLMSGKSLTRFNTVGVLSNPEPQLILEEQLRKSPQDMPLKFIRIFHNKAVTYGFSVVQKYFEQFSPVNIFITGEEPTRYKIPFHGLLYGVEFIPLLIGICVSISEKNRKKIGLIMLSMMLIAPLAAALTFQESPSSIRTFPMILPLLYFISIGILSLWNNKSIVFKLLFRVSLILGYTWCIGYFLIQLFTLQPYYRPWVRNYADQIMAEKLSNYLPTYEHVVVTTMASGQPYVFLAFHGIIDIPTLQQSYPKRTQDHSTIGKITFTSSECPLEGRPNTLYIILHSCSDSIRKQYTLLDSADYLDGAQAYDFVVLTKR